MMNDNELITYLTDKSGEYNKRKDWKWLQKNNAIIYCLLKNRYADILEETKVSEIYYRLKHNINEIPKCPVCGQPVKYTTNGYSTYCSKKCWTSDTGNKLSSVKHKETNLKKYGVENTQKIQSIEEKRLKNRAKNANSIKEKIKQTCLQKYGVENVLQLNSVKEKIKQTCLQKYGVEYGFQSNLVKEKIKQTCLQKYGVDNPMKNKEIWKNAQLKRTYSSKSKYELKVFEILKNIFGEENVINQYSSEKYPFHCDFYIKSINLYIELQGHWTHGPHPFNENDKNDLALLNTWIEKSNDQYYKYAVYTWTIRDIEKRNMAKQNNLNYLEIFGYNITNTKKYIEDYLLAYCNFSQIK